MLQTPSSDNASSSFAINAVWDLDDAFSIYVPRTKLSWSLRPPPARR